MLSGGVGSIAIPKAKLFRSMGMGGLLAFYLYVLNEKILNSVGAKVPSHKLLGF